MMTFFGYVFLSIVLVLCGIALGAWRWRAVKVPPLRWPEGFVVVDCETTGLDPRAHSLLSIGAIVPATGDEFYGECRVWPGAEVDDEALEVNGESMARCYDLDQQTEAELVNEFVRWAKERNVAITGGKNPSFDQNFLRAAWRRAHTAGGAEAAWPLPGRTIDLHSLAWGWVIRHRPDLFARTPLRTDDAYLAAGLNREAKPHRADTGALHEMEGFRFLLGRDGGVR